MGARLTMTFLAVAALASVRVAIFPICITIRLEHNTHNKNERDYP